MTAQQPERSERTEEWSSGNPNSIRRSTNKEDLRVRRQKALELRIAGNTYTEIMKQTKVNSRTVRDDIALMLKERDVVLIPQLRALEERRLDDALAAAYEVLTSHKGTELALKAVDRIVRAVSMRARLLGLDAPVELNVRTFEKTQADMELEELLREAEARNQVTREQLMQQATGDPDPTA
jgi:hypothetical protein